MTAITRKLPGAGLSRMIAAPERVSGMPARFIVPMLTAGVALQVAVLGMYWDVAYHIDHGRDAQVFTLPHSLIVLGLQGIFASAVLHGWMKGPRARGERRVGPLSLAPGGAVVLFCSSIALVGFPLDDVWHRLFGEDVTLWGPTHLFMIGGAGFSTPRPVDAAPPRQRARPPAQAHTAHRAAHRRRPADRPVDVPGRVRLRRPAVPDALPAGPDRVRGRGLARRRPLAARPLGRRARALIFFVIRGALALIVGPGMGFTTPHFPLYIVEALVVEAAAVLVPRSPLRFALLSGAGIGTLGLGASGSGATSGCRTPGPPHCCPRPLILTPAVAIGGAILGARIAQSLAPETDVLEPIPGRAVAIAGLAALVALAFPLPRPAATEPAPP